MAKKGLINRDADYAMRSLAFIAAKGGKVVTAESLVRELRIPKPFLRKILQKLEKKGFLYSRKGKGGGFALKVLAGRISAVDVIEAFQGRLKLAGCFLKKAICPKKGSCVFRKALKTIEARVREELGAVTVASLSKKG